MTVEFKEATDLHALARALEAAGCDAVNVWEGEKRITFYARGRYASFEGGRLNVPQGFNVAPVKVGYAREVMKAAAKKYGWAVQAAPAPVAAKLW